MSSMLRNIQRRSIRAARRKSANDFARELREHLQTERMLGTTHQFLQVKDSEHKGLREDVRRESSYEEFIESSGRASELAAPTEALTGGIDA